MRRATIERSNGRKGGHVGVLRPQPQFEGSQRLLIMTLVDLRQSVCGGSFLLQTAPSQVVLRAVTYSQLSNCGTGDSSFATAPGVEPIQCGGKFDTRDVLGTESRYGVCASANDRACSTNPLQGTSLESVAW